MNSYLAKRHINNRHKLIQLASFCVDNAGQT